MRILILAVAVLIVTTQPDIHRLDMAGWLLIVAVGLFLGFLDLYTLILRGMVIVAKREHDRLRATNETAAKARRMMDH